MDWTVSRLITVSLPIIILKKIKSSLKYWKTEVTPPPALKDALWTKLHFIHSDFRFSSDYKTSFLEHLQQKPFLCFLMSQLQTEMSGSNTHLKKNEDAAGVQTGALWVMPLRPGISIAHHLHANHGVDEEDHGNEQSHIWKCLQRGEGGSKSSSK